MEEIKGKNEYKLTEEDWKTIYNFANIMRFSRALRKWDKDRLYSIFFDLFGSLDLRSKNQYNNLILHIKAMEKNRDILKKYN